MTKKNKQEDFWKSKFTQDYINRNNLDDEICSLSSRSSMFFEIFQRIEKIDSITELGANIGMNLMAIKSIKPECRLSAVEINTSAIESLNNLNLHQTINCSILDLNSSDVENSDLVFTSGVLIHIAPNDLEKAYNAIYNNSNKYILIAEYYNPTPVMIPYHGVENVLFKRDFAGDLLDKFSDLVLIDYKFKYKRDNNFPLGDITWFLLKKSSQT